MAYGSVCVPFYFLQIRLKVWFFRTQCLYAIEAIMIDLHSKLHLNQCRAFSMKVYQTHTHKIFDFVQERLIPKNITLRSRYQPTNTLYASHRHSQYLQIHQRFEWYEIKMQIIWHYVACAQLVVAPLYAEECHLGAEVQYVTEVVHLILFLCRWARHFESLTDCVQLK